MRRHIIMDERRFRHSSLRNPSTEIRVLELLPSLRDGIIQCRLRHVKLKCKYVALSYVWGPPQPTRDILVNGQMFAIRQNLWNFLEMQFETSQTVGVLLDRSDLYQSQQYRRERRTGWLDVKHLLQCTASTDLARKRG